MVVRDKDAGDCKKLKAKLLRLCESGRRPDALIRIVCHHLESWFLGDLAAVEKAFSARGIAKRQEQKGFSCPDTLANAEQELHRLVPTYQKVGGSRLIAPHMDIEANRSHSFRVFVSGVRRLVNANTDESL